MGRYTALPLIGQGISIVNTHARFVTEEYDLIL